MASWNASRAACCPEMCSTGSCLRTGSAVGDYTALQRKDDLANFDLLTLFDLDLAHHAADRGRNFDNGFVGFEFHDRLTFRNARARRDHQPQQIAGVDVFSQFRQLELAGRGRSRRCRSLLRLRCNCGGWLRWGCGNWTWGNWIWGNYAGLRGRFFLFRSRRRSCSGSVFHSEDDLSHPQLVAFFYADFPDGARHRRRHFHNRLVGLELHHRLAFGDAGARLDHQANQVAALDVLAQFGQFEFRCHSSFFLEISLWLSSL